MKLYSYIVTHDTGFSPNPFWGSCTLANCKPGIRRTAEVGDWIVGLSRKVRGNRIVFAMNVEGHCTSETMIEKRQLKNGWKFIRVKQLLLRSFIENKAILKPLKAMGQLRRFSLEFAIWCPEYGKRRINRS